MPTDHLVLGGQKRSVAMQNVEHDVQQVEHHPRFGKLGGVDWHDLHVFREVGASTSLRQAARKLGVAVNTVRACIRRLEEKLGATLFGRGRGGIALTTDGQDLLALVLEMQTTANRLQFGRGNNYVVQQGELRIRCSEGVGELWLTPRLAELQSELPEHNIVIHNDFDQNRIHSSDYDLRLGFERPSEPDSVVTRLGSLHFMMYASQRYVSQRGWPQTIDEAGDHRLVVQTAPGLMFLPHQLFIGQAVAQNIPTVQVNTSYALYQAISHGVGIGALPTYISTISRNLIPLDLPIRLKFDLWLSFDPATKSSAPARATINWLRDAFDAVKFPWFGGNFLHPSAFASECARNGFPDSVPENYAIDAFNW